MFCGVPIWIGIDDTDSTMGGCTTYVAHVLIKKLVKQGYQIIGYPRLIRLNPNIPWKTRGNGAVSLHIGMGTGERIRIGEINSEILYAYTRLKQDYKEKKYHDISTIVQDTIEESAYLKDKTTNPGFVLLLDQADYTSYIEAVQEIVQVKTTKTWLDKHALEYKGYKNNRGLIGAIAATAWNPTPDKTYEFISYREPTRWGTPRQIDTGSVQTMDTTFSSTFDNYDYMNQHNRIVPNSPCPVLFGIRGESPAELVQAYSCIQSEPVHGWLLFETNQGTDEHLQKTSIEKIKPYQSVIVTGTVRQKPYTRQGGHVIFRIKDATGSIDCAAYEPTKQFRHIIRNLVVGDTVEVYGGVRKHPLTINIEKIRILHLKPVIEKVENPVCPHCGKHMKSKGKDQGYKCKTCGRTSITPIQRETQRSLHLGFYEVPVCARRHLSKPLQRITTQPMNAQALSEPVCTSETG